MKGETNSGREEKKLRRRGKSRKKRRYRGGVKRG